MLTPRSRCPDAGPFGPGLEYPGTNFGATGNWWITIQTRKRTPESQKLLEAIAERDRKLDALARPGRMVTENVTPSRRSPKAIARIEQILSE
jgi:hypothetical protein